MAEHANLDYLSHSDESLVESGSVADEVLDPDAAEAVLRELGKLCLFKDNS